MGLRFRKSFKIAPGVRLNVSKRGLSTSFGGRGASLNIGKRGMYANLGIPGSGISERIKISGTSRSSRSSGSSTRSFSGTTGNSTGYDDLFQIYVDEENEKTQRIIDIYLSTKSPHTTPCYESTIFETLCPDKAPNSMSANSQSILLIVALLVSYFISWYLLIPYIATVAFILYNDNKKLSYLKSNWENAKISFERNEEANRKRFDDTMSKIETDPEKALEAVLSRIPWPRETFVSFQIDGATTLMDVDLPEIDDMPSSTLKYLSRKKEFVDEKKSDTQIRKDYARHIHGVGMVLIGEVFRTIPFVNEVILSGYSQRPQNKTGFIEDEYLYSVRVKRDDWGLLNFENLSLLDPVASLEMFDLRRDMTKTGIFKTITPLVEIDKHVNSKIHPEAQPIEHDDKNKQPHSGVIPTDYELFIKSIEDSFSRDSSSDGARETS